MEPDDVVFPPEDPPPRRPRRRRYVLATAAALLAVGAVTAGASALTGSGDEPAKRPATSERRSNLSYTSDGVPFVRAGPECRAGQAKKRTSDAALKH
jgi:hypothetical protein